MSTKWRNTVGFMRDNFWFTLDLGSFGGPREGAHLVLESCYPLREGI